MLTQKCTKQTCNDEMTCLKDGISECMENTHARTHARLLITAFYLYILLVHIASTSSSNINSTVKKTALCVVIHRPGREFPGRSKHEQTSESMNENIRPLFPQYVSSESVHHSFHTSPQACVPYSLSHTLQFLHHNWTHFLTLPVQ